MFLSGCPLRCQWCANPEGMRKKHNLMYTKGRCKAIQNHCSRCMTACPQGAITMNQKSGLPQIQRVKCMDCTEFACTRVCNYEALRISGKEYTVEELMEVIRRDRVFWQGNGGVTFGGGDPLVQWEFLVKVLEECKKHQIHTAIETEGYAEEAIFLHVLSYIDFAFVDLKHMDPQKHEEKTGVSNERILKNLRALKTSGWKGRIILRTPIIPGFNDSAENARATIAFMKEVGFFEINLLPFHRMGTSKWEQLGLEYVYRDQPNLTKEDLYSLQQLYLDAGIACYVDTDVIYSVRPLKTP